MIDQAAEKKICRVADVAIQAAAGEVMGRILQTVIQRLFGCA
jgi:hypothetical protein